MCNQPNCFFMQSQHTDTGPTMLGTDPVTASVVKVSASRAEDPRFESLLRQDFSGLSHTSDFKIGTPVATLPGAWCYRVSAGTGVSIL